MDILDGIKNELQKEEIHVEPIYVLDKSETRQNGS